MSPTPLHARYRARAMQRGWRGMDRALRRPCAYPHPAGRIVRIETHLSVVYLAGRYAYKIMKPVAFGFVDFSTREARLFACRAELRLNRLLAKPLYLDVVPIARRARSFALARRGEVVEHAVKMRRFDESEVFSELRARGELTARDIDVFSERLADCHRRAPRHPPRHGFGTAPCVREQVEAVLGALEREAPEAVPRGARAWCESELARLAAHLDARRAAGFVRGCHGDLHLANIVRRGRDVLMFDCIEFSDALRWIDIASDLAFPVMDLLAHGEGRLAARLVNGWATATGDFAGLAALRLYVVYRALVRALVAELKARERGERKAAPEAARYRRVVERAIEPAPAFLLLCHGFSGSGKSAASAALAPLIGAVRVASDIERKRAAPLTAPDGARLAAAAYTRDAIDAQYARLERIAGTLLRDGYPVIVDASFLRHAHRSRFVELARAHAAPAWILDFQADPDCLARRVRERSSRPGGPSDADEAVLRGQFASAEPFTGEEAARSIAFATNVGLAEFESLAFWQALRERVPACGWLAAGAWRSAGPCGAPAAQPRQRKRAT